MDNDQKTDGTAMQPPGGTGRQPPDPEGTQQATNDNDLTSGHSRPGDGGDANAKGKKDLDTSGR